jgi:hypothetical protein
VHAGPAVQVTAGADDRFVWYFEAVAPRVRVRILAMADPKGRAHQMWHEKRSSLSSSCSLDLPA